MLQEELKSQCKHDANLKWRTLFLSFIDDGFGIFEGTKKDVEYWINQFTVYHTQTQPPKFRVFV